MEALAQGVAERALDVVLAALDLNALLDRVDPNELLDRVDPNALLDRVDVDRLLNHVDVGELLKRVDIDALLARVDMAAVIDRVDVNEVAARLDIEALVENTDLGPVIAKSSGGFASNALDLLRSQAVGLDEFIARWVSRLRRRNYTGPPGPPELLRSPDTATAAYGGASAGAPPVAWAGLHARFAGYASRFAAFLADVAVGGGVFMVALAALSFAVSVLTGHQITWSRGNLVVLVAFICWAFVYFAYSWAASGKTFGMALLGICVVRSDGADAGARRALVRTLAFPLSFLFFGLGFLGVLADGERRALHDVIAGTRVIYAWDARAARLRFLARETPARLARTYQ
jgi:uncharacterized RDD family membrane protein YckC